MSLNTTIHSQQLQNLHQINSKQDSQNGDISEDLHELVPQAHKLKVVQL